jgi:hypothetical protein
MAATAPRKAHGGSSLRFVLLDEIGQNIEFLPFRGADVCIHELVDPFESSLIVCFAPNGLDFAHVTLVCIDCIVLFVRSHEP